MEVGVEMTNNVSEFERLSCAECEGGCKACGGTCEETDQQLRERVLKRLEETYCEVCGGSGVYGGTACSECADDSSSPWGPAREEYGCDLRHLIPITDTDFARVAELLSEAVSELLDCEAPGVTIEVKGKTIAVSFSVTPWSGRKLEGVLSVKD